jgi:hypothetical protein
MAISIYNTLHYIIIQLTPHWGFSVTDYMTYYAHVTYTKPIEYLSLQQLRYFFPNYVYPNPPFQFLPCGRKPEHPEKTDDFRQSVD